MAFCLGSLEVAWKGTSPRETDLFLHFVLLAVLYSSYTPLFPPCFLTALFSKKIPVHFYPIYQNPFDS